MLQNIYLIFLEIPILPIHLLVLLFTFTWIIISDFNGFLWIIGKKSKIEKAQLEKYHIYVWYGLLGMIMTGLLLLLQKPYLLENLNFKIKMFFVFLLFVNSFFIGKHMILASIHSFINLNKKEKSILIFSGLISIFSWLGAFLAALMR